MGAVPRACYSPRMPRAYAWLIAILVVLMLVGLAASYWLTGRVPSHGKPLIEAAPLTAQDCDLHAGACVTEREGARVSLALAPRPIQALRTLDIAVRVEGLPVQAAALAFSGVDMYMGHNRVRLQPAGEGMYVGEGTLPVCVTGRMTWSAEVILEGHDAVRVFPFHFDVPAS